MISITCLSRQRAFHKGTALASHLSRSIFLGPIHTSLSPISRGAKKRGEGGSRIFHTFGMLFTIDKFMTPGVYWKANISSEMKELVLGWSTHFPSCVQIALYPFMIAKKRGNPCSKIVTEIILRSKSFLIPFRCKCVMSFKSCYYIFLYLARADRSKTAIPSDALVGP